MFLGEKMILWDGLVTQTSFFLIKNICFYHFYENCLINKENTLFFDKIALNDTYCYIYNILAIHKPIAIAITPILMLAKVYNEKCSSSPVRNKECSSKAKVENVVKPPQKPVANNKV